MTSIVPKHSLLIQSLIIQVLEIDDYDWTNNFIASPRWGSCPSSSPDFPCPVVGWIPWLDNRSPCNTSRVADNNELGYLIFDVAITPRSSGWFWKYISEEDSRFAKRGTWHTIHIHHSQQAPWSISFFANQLVTLVNPNFESNTIHPKIEFWRVLRSLSGESRMFSMSRSLSTSKKTYGNYRRAITIQTECNSDTILVTLLRCTSSFMSHFLCW